MISVLLKIVTWNLKSRYNLLSQVIMVEIHACKVPKFESSRDGRAEDFMKFSS